VVVFSGLAVIWKYKSTPGLGASPPSDWPTATALERRLRGPTLVMIAHPYCPCTRASLAELSRLMSRIAGRADAYVVFVAPEGVADGEDWTSQPSWRQAAAIPGVRVVRDEHGAEAARFGAHTSGQIVVYDENGRLAFRGGITGARGHEGDNEGRARALAALLDGRVDRETSPVFGCDLGSTVTPPKGL
jgi:hypothetical protein